MNNMIFKASFEQGQGLGNQLWLYASLRSIAKYHEAEFCINGNQFYKGNNFLEIDFGRDELKNESYEQFFEYSFYDHELNYLTSVFDNRVFSLNKNSEIFGLFQSEKYINGNQHLLRDWIKLSRRCKEKSKEFSNVTVLNLRGGEFKNHKNLILPNSYWTNAINFYQVSEGIHSKDIAIVTDDYKYAKKLFPHNEIISGNIEDCYAAIHGAKNLIVSNSSFSYFPIKTRLDSPCVIAPAYWARFNKNLNRWTMPVNYYENWKWLDAEGKILDKEECDNITKETEVYYKNNYHTFVHSSRFNLKPWTRFIPSKIKEHIRKIGSTLLPEKIG